MLECIQMNFPLLMFMGVDMIEDKRITVKTSSNQNVPELVKTPPQIDQYAPMVIKVGQNVLKYFFNLYFMKCRAVSWMFGWNCIKYASLPGNRCTWGFHCFIFIFRIQVRNPKLECNFDHGEVFYITKECQCGFIIWKHKNNKWVWSGNTTITNCRQPCGTARKSRPTITRHQEDKPSIAISSLFPIKMIALLERTLSNVHQNVEQLQTPTMGVTINKKSTTTGPPP